MEYLKILGYMAKKDGKMEKEPFDTYTAQVNPSSIKIGHSVNYGGDDKKETGGQAIPQQKYKGTGTQTLSFQLILDGTGVLPKHSEVPDISVKEQIEHFKKVCYYYKGEIHEPPYVEIKWNKESLFKYSDQPYYARIKSFDVEYTLFSSYGEPLRAKINASFVGSLDPKTESNVKGATSPDLTHVIVVRAGDSLPMLCEKIYGKRQMYHEVAKVNNLLSFRNIEPGTELVFPPIK